MSALSFLPGAPSRDRLPTHVLRSIESRVLWLAVRMVDLANEHPSPDGMKVGGHQASSASAVTILTTLWMRHLRGFDQLSVKPHASPVLHALEYLCGLLDASYLGRLREAGGLQAYPSRTKDPDRVDFSTGSVGLGAAAPLFAAVADRFSRDHTPTARERPDFIAVVGDAELDEGNVWEAITDPCVDGIDNVLWVVDLNRQSLDRVVPRLKVRRLMEMFRANGWHVLEAKYGRRLQQLFEGDGGEALRAHLDRMPNERYQFLFGLPSGEFRAAFTEGADPAVHRSLAGVGDPDLIDVVTDLGGHDPDVLSDCFDTYRQLDGAPTVIFAYTVKGWRLPIAGNRLNHAALLSAAQIAELRTQLGADPTAELARFPAGSPEAGWCAEIGERLRPRPVIRARPVTVALPVLDRIPPTCSTQEAFGRCLGALADRTELRELLVTASPDVTISTNLGGWVNKVGVYDPVADPAPIDRAVLRWEPAAHGRHIELGISEMNLFLLLGQLGRTADWGEPTLVPIGTVYDPFVLRGLDAFIYGLYGGARFIVVGTPSGVTLSREGGAHQSTVTPSVGLELPLLVSAEPAFAGEVEWLLAEAIEEVAAGREGSSRYLRLSTRPVDQEPFARRRAEVGDETLRAEVLSGGYRLYEVGDGPQVVIAASGAVVSEAISAADLLAGEGVSVAVVNLVSADRLHREWVASGRQDLRTAQWRRPRTRIEALLGEPAGITTVVDGASHALSWVGAVNGVPTVPLGVDEFGQSGALADLYGHFDLLPESIANAALVALYRGARRD